MSSIGLSFIGLSFPLTTSLFLSLVQFMPSSNRRILVEYTKDTKTRLSSCSFSFSLSLSLSVSVALLTRNEVQ
jgi:hypothetical protein